MEKLELVLQEKPVTVVAVYVGKRLDGGHVQDRFIVTLQYQGRKIETEFFMGIGHRVLPKHLPGYPEFGRYAGKKVPYFGVPRALQSRLEKLAKPVPPKPADVVYSLLTDGTAGDMTFEEFCAEFGYDTDSRKVLDIYLACQQNGHKIKKLLGADYQFFMENNEY